MELVILGSGGSTTTPRPGCECRVCTEARVKGIPYARSGPSMFVSGVNALFDTPEEIAGQLNRQGINRVDYVFYTHWHPDHTFGMRIVERMYKFWLDMFVHGKKPRNKAKVCAASKVMEDLKSMGYKGGTFLQYYEKSGLIDPVELESKKPFCIGSVKVTPFETLTTYCYSTVFLIQEGRKRVVYAPCDVKPFPETTDMENLDLLIIGSFHPEGPLKEGLTISRNNPLRKELFSLEEITELAGRLKAKKTMITHIEEEWGKTYDEYKQLEDEYDLEFAFDGLKLNI